MPINQDLLDQYCLNWALTAQISAQMSGKLVPLYSRKHRPRTEYNKITYDYLGLKIGEKEIERDNEIIIQKSVGFWLDLKISYQFRATQKKKMTFSGIFKLEIEIGERESGTAGGSRGGQEC